MGSRTHRPGAYIRSPTKRLPFVVTSRPAFFALPNALRLKQMESGKERISVKRAAQQFAFGPDGFVSLLARRVAGGAARIPGVLALVAVAALCGEHQTRAQQETFSPRNSIPLISGQATPLSALSLSSAARISDPAGARRFCLPVDPEQPEQERRISSVGKGALRVGPPRTVRMIYFLPNDRPYRSDVVDLMKTMISWTQGFYAEQMQSHGYGEKTFRIETDADGEPLIHRVDGQHPDAYYHTNTVREALNEVQQTFDLGANVYFIVSDNAGVNEFFLGANGQLASGVGSRSGKSGGYLMLPSAFSFNILSHELGHAFGLQHDFRNNANVMSYGSGIRLSECSAGFLAVHPYFNPDSPVEEGSRPSVELVSALTYPADSDSAPVQIKASDPEGLHQAILFVRTTEPHRAAGTLEVNACLGLAGVRDRVVEFDYDGAHPSVEGVTLSNPPVHPIRVDIVDADGDAIQRYITLEESSSGEVVALERDAKRPAAATLTGNYPNPFNPETTIGYALPRSGKVRLSVHDMLGHELHVLVDRYQPAGRHAALFRGDRLPSGLYAYRLEAGGEAMVRTMLLVK